MNPLNRLRLPSHFLLVFLISMVAFALQVGHVSLASATTLTPSLCPPNCTFAVNSLVDSPHLFPIAPGVCADQETPAKCSLRAAIEEASLPPLVNTIITVPAGTYNLNPTLGTLQLNANTITITGTGGNAIVNGNNSFTLMFVASGAKATLNTLTMNGGNAGNSGGGGAIYNNGGKLTVDSCIVSLNTAYEGGGIYNDNSGKLTVKHSTISNNSSFNGGGGIYNSGGTVMVTKGSTISSNSTTFDDGGGINDVSGTVTVTNSTISHNTATNGDSGGIGNDTGKITVTNSAIIKNTAGMRGGGIENEGPDNISESVTITNSTLSGNSAPAGGGINSGGIVTITNSTFSDNSAPGQGGGGIQNGSGTITVSNSTFNGNRATNGGHGGGIQNEGGMVTVTNSTFSDNADNGGGGAFYNDVGTITLTATIAATYKQNGSTCFGTITDGGSNLEYKLAGPLTCAFVDPPVNGANPLLGPLQNNGGPTQTRALLLGSPAIDWVSSGLCPTTDQRGSARPDDPQNETTCDIGAYESFKIG